MRADGVARREQFADAFGRISRLLADGEEGRLHAFGRKDVQHLVAVAWQRPVVESQHYFMIGERKRFRILHGADAGMLPGIDHQRARRPERVRMARAIGGRGRVDGKAGKDTASQSCPPPRSYATPRSAHEEEAFVTHA